MWVKISTSGTIGIHASGTTQEEQAAKTKLVSSKLEQQRQQQRQQQQPSAKCWFRLCVTFEPGHLFDTEQLATK
jgi:transcription initiation factor TFIID subunit TAF12